MAKPDHKRHRIIGTGVPEEGYGSGHDALPEPAEAVPGITSSVLGGPSDAPADPSKVDDAKFLTDEFDMPEQTAAELTAAPEASEDDIASAAAAVREQRAKDDPLAHVPTPRDTANDLTADADETALKPVLHRDNNRTGAG